MEYEWFNYLGAMSRSNYFLLAVLAALIVACTANPNTANELVNLPDMPELTESVASDFVDLSLHCVERPYPYKIGYRFPSEEWVKPHREVHPSFYGCWDWHSAVHGHWAMVKVLKTFPDIDKKDSIRRKLRTNLTQKNLAAEYDFFANQPFTNGFERTYGWAWLLKLYAELSTWEDEEGQQWKQNMKPLAELLAQKTRDYLQVLSSPCVLALTQIRPSHLD